MAPEHEHKADSEKWLVDGYFIPGKWRGRNPDHVIMGTTSWRGFSDMNAPNDSLTAPEKQERKLWERLASTIRALARGLMTRN